MGSALDDTGRSKDEVEARTALGTPGRCADYHILGQQVNKVNEHDKYSPSGLYLVAFGRPPASN